MKKIALFLCLVMLSTFIGCNQRAIDNRPVIAVSIAPQKTFIEKVCGENFKIITMIPAGASAESYEPTPKDIQSFADSNIYFSIGVPAEEKGILPHMSKKTALVPLADKVNSEYPDLKIGTERDPHIWLSIKRVIVMIGEITKQVSEIDPENREFYQNNAYEYIKELETLSNDIWKLLENRETDLFFISHPSYGYFAEDFGLNMIALEKHGKEATSKELTYLTRLAEENNIKNIFCQEESSKKQAELIAKELGGKVLILSPLSPDYTENLLNTARLIAEG